MVSAERLDEADMHRQPILQNDPHWRDLVLSCEYYHGDNGAGIGARYQAGWTGTVGLLPPPFRGINAERLLARRGASPNATTRRRKAAAR